MPDLLEKGGMSKGTVIATFVNGRYLRMALPEIKQCTAAIKQRTKMVRFRCN
ncbi:hypothetical protein [Janthinobacterium sp. MDB2-8]|uniref:hypothetical protein n=1 Tax=Janthinobacterium sp. MDB2-8 TaxID=1259338 RepID=UPI003F25868A